MTDTKILQEMALNRREITHDVWGSFIISRPTNRVLSKIETARTKSLNRDLQTTMTVETDDGTKEVPAILTRKSKERILRMHQEWTDEDDQELLDATNEYQKVCFELEEAGYRGLDFITEAYDEIHDKFEKKLGDKYEKYLPDVKIVIPTIMDSEPPDTVDEEELTAQYYKAKGRLEKYFKDISLSADFDKLDNLHKQYRLYVKGVVAQTRLYVIKYKEITLYADTAEARADKDGQLTKIVECTKSTDGSPAWASIDEAQEENPDKLAWLLSQIERFERLDPTEKEIDERVRNRFNFLFPLGDTSTLFEKLDAQRKSKEDGESPEDTQKNSTEDLGTKE